LPSAEVANPKLLKQMVYIMSENTTNLWLTTVTNLPEKGIKWPTARQEVQIKYSKSASLSANVILISEFYRLSGKHRPIVK
jgi:hypothetical protein